MYNVFMKLKRILEIIVVVLCMIYLSYVLVSRVSKVPYKEDEISWYFHTKFFDEAFINKSLFSPLWQGYESFDHPPVSKYIYGAYLYFQNRNYAQERNVLESKYGRWNFYYVIKSDEAIATTEFAPIISDLRKINFVFAVFILVEVYILFYMISRSSLFSLLLCAVLSINSLFIYSVAIITSDNQVIFFSLLAIILYFMSLKSKKWVLLVGAAIATALALGSKLTGIFILCTVTFNEILCFLYARLSYEKFVKRIGIFIFVSCFVWVIINPALYFAPVINTVRYFEFRSFQSANLAHFFPNIALHTPFVRIEAIVCTVLVPCNNRFTSGAISSNILVNILLLTFGLFYCVQEVRKKRSDIIFLVLFVYFICFVYTINLFNYSKIYYNLLQISIFIIQVLGGLFVVKFIERKYVFTRRNE